LLNLNGQLTSGSENKNDRTITRSQERLGVDVDDGGQTVGKCLTGTGLGNTDDIATGQSHGPALGLDGSRSREALSLHLVHDITGKTSLVESLNRLGDITTVDGHGVVLAELLDLSGRASSDIRVLLVEVLLELGKGIEIPLLLVKAGTKVVHAVTAAAIAATAAVATTTTTVSAAAGISVGATANGKR
jgi:hypothetical protein